jgi:hypothetical protein
MTTPRVLNLKTDKISGSAVFIGRPSKWGNPFHIGRDGTRHEVIARYMQYLFASPELLAALHELKGKDLVCHCSPKPCHGDVLLELANKDELLKEMAERE